MARVSFVLVALLLVVVFQSRLALSGMLFSSLPRTLLISMSAEHGQVLKAGKDSFTVSWGLNRSHPLRSEEGGYKEVKALLCYAPCSQIDRGWRRTSNDLSKDKTCQFTMTMQPYTKGNKNSFHYNVSVDLPTATYFVRAYVFGFDGKIVAYGQTTDADKTTNLIHIVGVSGRELWLDIAAGCFTALSSIVLLVFVVVERKQRLKRQSKI